jgi:signal transduction histidine kinase
MDDTFLTHDSAAVEVQHLRQRVAELEARDAAREMASQQLETQLREQTATITTINSVGQMLSAELDLHKLVQIVTDAATGLVGAQFGAFFYNLQDERGERYTLYTISGVDPEAFAQYPMPRATAVFGPTFHGEGVIRLANLQTDSRYGQNAPYHGMPKGHLPVRSYMAVPVISRSGSVWGGLFFGHAEEGVFDERAEQIVTGLAAQTAIAMDNAQLYQDAQRAIQIRDEFLSLAAHELKTPMTTILGYVQMLQRRLERGQADIERVTQAVTTLEEQARRLENLISTLFDLSRLRAGQLHIEPTTIDLVALVKNIVEALRPIVDEHTLMLEHVGAEPMLVLADPRRIEQVVNNLLQNALKYSPNGGQIDVRVERQESDACLSIRDQGMGIPASALPQLFTRFYRATNVERKHISGLGIGLYIVKDLITQHGGSVEVQSDEGKGATFHIRLPLQHSPPDI